MKDLKEVDKLTSKFAKLAGEWNNEKEATSLEDLVQQMITKELDKQSTPHKQVQIMPELQE